MEANKILNRRKSFRIDTQMSGYYSLGGKKGITIYLKLEASTQSKPFTIKGKLAWIKKTHNGFSGGIKW
jgi:hypothetical protein